MRDQAVHNLLQPRIGRAGEPLHHSRGDVMFIEIAHWRPSSSMTAGMPERRLAVLHKTHGKLHENDRKKLLF
jgi:hypothetical protein